jgi:hypothetical protein
MTDTRTAPRTVTTGRKPDVRRPPEGNLLAFFGSETLQTIAKRIG